MGACLIAMMPVPTLTPSYLILEKPLTQVLLGLHEGMVGTPPLQRWGEKGFIVSPDCELNVWDAPLQMRLKSPSPDL